MKRNYFKQIKTQVCKVCFFVIFANNVEKKSLFAQEYGNGNFPLIEVDAHVKFKGSFPNFLNRNLRYPKVALKLDSVLNDGIVYIDYKVDTSGKIFDIKIDTQASSLKHPIFYNECIRVMKLTNNLWEVNRQYVKDYVNLRQAVYFLNPKEDR